MEDYPDIKKQKYMSFQEIYSENMENKNMEEQMNSEINVKYVSNLDEFLEKPMTTRLKPELVNNLYNDVSFLKFLSNPRFYD